MDTKEMTEGGVILAALLVIVGGRGEMLGASSMCG